GRFIADDVLHLVWADGTRDRALIRCIDFDVNKRRWLHSRELFGLESGRGSLREPTVLQRKDGSLHFLWKSSDDLREREASSVYYQAEPDGKTVKVASAAHYRAVSTGDHIIVCYTVKDAPEKVCFRIIKNGVLGPVAEITLDKK